MKVFRRFVATGLATWCCWVLPTMSLGCWSTASGQTVQLPTYRVFQMPLNVVVPDGGTAVIGGTKHATSSQSTRGLPLFGPVSRHRAHSRGSNSVSVSATIIDHRQWDAAILADAARHRPDRPKSPERLAAERMTRQIGPVAPAAHSVDELAAQAQRKVDNRRSREEAEALQLIQHGNECLKKGQYGAARLFFRTAMRRSSGTAHRLALQRLNAIAHR